MSSRFGFACALATVAVVQAFPPGCTVEGEAYLDELPGNPISVASPELCQEQCASNDNCTHWAFWPSPEDECWLGGSGDRSMRQTQAAAISGPKVCEDPPVACSENPAASFPSGNVTADWPLSGFQPKKLQCYPTDCTAVTTLEDVNGGWPGKCKDLSPVTLSDDETCESSCLHRSCASYQVGEDGSCWQGIGLDCSLAFDWDPSFQPSEAKRFQHGEVRVMKQLIGIRIEGLSRVFNDSNIAALGGDDEAKESCRKVCYSVLGCEYWQLSNATGGTGGGCWIDTDGDAAVVPYPLLDTSLLAPSNDWIAGEYIQRYCPAGSSETAAAEEGGSSSMPIWLLLVLLLLCLAGIAGLVYYFLCMNKSKPSKGKSKKPKRTTPEMQETASPLMVTSQTPVQTAAYPLPAYQVVSPPLLVSTQQMPVAMAQPVQVAPPVYTSTSAVPAATSYTVAPAPVMAYTSTPMVAAAPMAA